MPARRGDGARRRGAHGRAERGVRHLGLGPLGAAVGELDGVGARREPRRQRGHARRGQRDRAARARTAQRAHSATTRRLLPRPARQKAVQAGGRVELSHPCVGARSERILGLCGAPGGLLRSLRAPMRLLYEPGITSPVLEKALLEVLIILV